MNNEIHIELKEQMAWDIHIMDELNDGLNVEINDMLWLPLTLIINWEYEIHITDELQIQR